MSTRRGSSFDRRLARAAGSAAALGWLLIGGAARAQEPPASDSSGSPEPAAPSAAAAAQAIPPQRTETEPRKGIIIGGAITWATAYTYSLIGAGANDGDSARHWLYVPVAGPFLFLANREHCPGEPGGCVDDFLTPVLFAMFGAVQTLGAALFAGGFLFPRERVVTGEGAPSANGAPRPVTWFATPSVVGQSGLGVAAAGTLF
jgi:hypothetical protein